MCKIISRNKFTTMLDFNISVLLDPQNHVEKVSSKSSSGKFFLTFDNFNSLDSIPKREKKKKEKFPAVIKFNALSVKGAEFNWSSFQQFRLVLKLIPSRKSQRERNDKNRQRERKLLKTWAPPERKEKICFKFSADIVFHSFLLLEWFSLECIVNSLTVDACQDHIS